jgi:flavin reductase (DIM6/NTAB) family NADH-FMN oxidoreductase RutF/DNA-binding IclR family transcriptional regulator
MPSLTLLEPTMSNKDAFDQRKLRDVLGTFVTGVTVVTTCDAAGVCHGVTANSFTSVSLEPPLVLWSQALSSRSYPAFRDSDHFAVNILADDQVALSNHFAKSKEDKFKGIDHQVGLGGVPVLEGTAAHLECVKVASYAGGDHIVYMGRIERVSHSGRRPLAFGSGRYMVAHAHDLGPVSSQHDESAPGRIEAVRMATDALPGICEEVGQHTLCLAVWGNHGPTVIRWEPSRQPVSQQLRTGMVLSITRSATGRAFAAFLPEGSTRTLIESDLRLCATSDEDPNERRIHFERDVAEARQRGMSRVLTPSASQIDQVPIIAFSAPIFDAGGTMIMALSLTTPSERLTPDWDGPVPEALARAAADLSRRLKQLDAVTPQK